jgi:hypothetical protein
MGCRAAADDRDARRLTLFQNQWQRARPDSFLLRAAFFSTVCCSAKRCIGQDHRHRLEQTVFVPPVSASIHWHRI